MKARNLTLIILAVLVADQALKFYIKLHFYAYEDHPIVGDWFHLLFVENEGMAWGYKFGGKLGKIALTLFRLAAVVWGVFLLREFIAKKFHQGFIICAGLIFAGALGNLLDSMFYGLIFDASSPDHIAKLFPKGGGYTSFLFGQVVDMLHFPLIQTKLPTWVPFWGGEQFVFFDPIFNLADASISIGVMAILIFQNKFFKKEGPPALEPAPAKTETLEA